MLISYRELAKITEAQSRRAMIVEIQSICSKIEIIIDSLALWLNAQNSAW